MPELKREQSEAVFHNEGSILVSASAGSGKTFVMIERLIRLISEGKAHVKEMLAVTFTESAAADMKEKLKAALIRKINEGATGLAAELSEVPAADISTLHSFCSRLLRQYFFAAGIAPDFSIADEDRAKEIREDCADRLIRELYESGDKDFLTLCARYRAKRSDDAFKSLVLSLYEYSRSEENPEEYLSKYAFTCSKEGFAILKAEYAARLNAALEGLIARAREVLSECERTGFIKGAAFSKTLIEDMAALKNKGLYAVKDYEEYKLRADFGQKLESGALKLKGLIMQVKAEFASAAKRYSRHLTEPERDEKMNETLLPHTRALVKTVLAFGEEYARAKREENVLDFSDLEHLTLKALSDKEVAAAVRGRYKYIFADEYQDINGVQERILSTLCADNLFMVGDVKQSIYGFRGCRPEIFAAKERAMKESGQKTVALNHNFRSAPAVIDLVNRIFDFSMTESSAGLDYRGTARLISGGIYPHNACGRAEIHLLKTSAKTREKEQPRVYDVMEEIKKGRYGKNPPIASLVTEIINGELQKEYYDPKSKQFKRIGFSDIAILTRNRNNSYISGLVAGLMAHGVPVVSEVRENACDFPEIAALINALKLIDCFYQDIPLIGTLLSPMGGFTEEELAETALYYSDNYRPQNGRRSGFTDAFLYYTDNSRSPLAERYKRFVAYFEEVRFIADFTGAAGALKRLVQDCGYENYLLASRGGEAKARRLHAFLSAAEGDKRYTVKEFLSRTERGKEAFSVAEEAEEDAVRVMTIHASKGLEFPIVIVCGLERRANSEEEREEVLTDREYGIAARYFNDAEHTVTETPARGVMRERMRENRVKEELRLFYVALTRAAYSLHLTFEGREDGRKEKFYGAEKFIDYVPADIPVTEWNEEDFAFTDLTRERRQIILSRADGAALEKMKENFAYVYPFAADTALPLKGSVTAALERRAEREYSSRVIFNEEDETDKERGITAHKIMQYFDFSRGDVKAQAEEMIYAGLLTEEEAARLDFSRMQRAVDSGVFAGIENYGLLRERQFIAEAPADMVFGVNSGETVLLQGVIDLLCVKDDEAKIIDYKYSALTAGALIKKYSLQLELYAMAAEKALGVKVKSKILVNLFTGETAEC